MVVTRTPLEERLKAATVFYWIGRLLQELVAAGGAVVDVSPGLARINDMNMAKMAKALRRWNQAMALLRVGALVVAKAANPIKAWMRMSTPIPMVRPKSLLGRGDILATHTRDTMARIPTTIPQIMCAEASRKPNETSPPSSTWIPRAAPVTRNTRLEFKTAAAEPPWSDLNPSALYLAN